VTFQTSDDLCLSFWKRALDSGWVNFPPKARVLEIGCAEADWQTPMLAVRPDLQITGVDWRKVQRPGRVIQGDVMNASLFPGKSFDAIVSISAIEHVGLGAYEQDPLDEDGDVRAMDNAFAWLKPGGFVYLDVPFQAHGPMLVLPSYRRYGEMDILERLARGFTVEKSAQCVCDHPDSPYMALLLRKA
jgi:SAM-dependent methyltransferase